MSKDTHTLLLQAGVAVLAWALPSVSTLTTLADSVRKGLLATIVAGVLFASIILIISLISYKLLLASGFGAVVSLSIILIAILLCALISSYVAKCYLSKSAKKTKRISIFGQTQEVSLEDLMIAVLDGYLQAEKKHEK